MNCTHDMEFHNLHDELNNLVVLLTEACSALDMLHEQMEADGFQYEERFEKWKAINFSRRLPMYLSTYRVIQRDLENTVKLMEVCAEQVFEVYKSQKEAVV